MRDRLLGIETQSRVLRDSFRGAEALGEALRCSAIIKASRISEQKKDYGTPKA